MLVLIEDALAELESQEKLAEVDDSLASIDEMQTVKCRKGRRFGWRRITTLVQRIARIRLTKTTMREYSLSRCTTQAVQIVSAN